MHIGLIGGIGPAATEFYYRGLVRNHASTSAALELTIAHADTNALIENVTAGAADEQARIFCHHVHQLAGAGATVAAVTSIAGHFCISELESISPLPVVSALAALRLEIERRGPSRVGLLGSKIAVESKLYGSVDGIEIVVPSDDDIHLVDEAYFAMVKEQRASSAQRDLFFNVGDRLCSKQNAEIVVLAGTDMFLAFAGADPAFDVIDCAEVHIKELTSLVEGSGTELTG